MRCEQGVEKKTYEQKEKEKNENVLTRASRA